VALNIVPVGLYHQEGGLDVLKKKVDGGADFIVTQLFYDADRFLKWVDKVREKG